MKSISPLKCLSPLQRIVLSRCNAKGFRRQSKMIPSKSLEDKTKGKEQIMEKDLKHFQLKMDLLKL